jgi:hypothetical protein
MSAVETREEVQRVSDGPWRTTTVAGWAAFVGLGSLAVVVGWLIASGQSGYARQLSPAGLAGCGVILTGVAHGALLVRGRHAVAERRRAVIDDLYRDVAVPVPLGTAVRTLVGGEGNRLFHDSECLLARDRGWVAAPRAGHLAAGRAPCKACNP